jgi:hypothetical protein
MRSGAHSGTHQTTARGGFFISKKKGCSFFQNNLTPLKRYDVFFNKHNAFKEGLHGYRDYYEERAFRDGNIPEKQK